MQKLLDCEYTGNYYKCHVKILTQLWLNNTEYSEFQCNLTSRREVDSFLRN